MNQQTNHLKLSVFVVVSHAEEVFKHCVLTLVEALPKDGELVLLFNGRQLEKEAWVKGLQNPQIVSLRCEKTCVSKLRNRAFTECSGDIIYFLDDDVIAPKDLLHAAKESFERDDSLSIIGGPNLTPPGSSFGQKLFGAVLTSPFAAPFVFTRYTRRKDKPKASGLDLILCNLALRRKHVSKSLRFYEGLYPNEETLFLHRARRKGLRISYFEKLFVYHHRRKTLFSFLKQVRGYGYGRGKQTFLEPLSLPSNFAVPALSLIFLLPNFVPLEILGGLYALGSVAGWMSSREARSIGPVGVIAAPLLTLGVHFSYALGVAKAFCHFAWFPKGDTSECPRLYKFLPDLDFRGLGIRRHR